MSVEALNITLMGAGDSFLRLNHFKIVSYSGAETILRLGECLFSEIDGTASDLDLLGGGVQVEQRGADLVVDASAKIAELLTSLLQLRVGHQYLTVNFVTGKNRNV